MGGPGPREDVVRVTSGQNVLTAARKTTKKALWIGDFGVWLFRLRS